MKGVIHHLWAVACIPCHKGTCALMLGAPLQCIGAQTGLICYEVLATSSAHPRVIKTSLLYGVLKQGEAYLLPFYFPRQVQTNQSMLRLGAAVCRWDVLEWKFPDWAAVTGPAINILKGAILAADRVMTVSQVGQPPVWANVCACVCVCASVHACVCVCVSVLACACVCLCVRRHACVCVRAHAI